MTHLFDLHLRLLITSHDQGLQVYVLECDDSYAFPHLDLPVALASVATEIIRDIACHTEVFCPALPLHDFQWRALARKTDSGPVQARTLDLTIARQD